MPDLAQQASRRPDLEGVAVKARKLDHLDGTAFAAITRLDPAYVEMIDALPDDIAAMVLGAVKDVSGYSTSGQLAVVVTRHLRKIGETSVRRRLADLPCRFVGRDRLYPSVLGLLRFAQELAAAPKIAGNTPPPPRSRGMAAPRADSPGEAA
jgi:hypothetical protein